MAQKILVAYDASINAEWVTWYAMRLASRTPERRLRLLTVDDGTLDARALPERFARIERACGELAITLETAVVPLRGTVVDTLATEVPPGRDTLLCCGTRARNAGRGLLGGTVSARLLEVRPCEVLAIHVVSPGLLGAPRRILYALSQNPKSVSRALPFLELLAAGIEELSLLTVMETGLGLGGLTNPQRQRLLTEGRAYLERQADVLREGLPAPVPRIDPHVFVAGDIPQRIVGHAARVRAELLLLGATERSLPLRIVFGSPLERVLEAAPCDVAIFRDARNP